MNQVDIVCYTSKLCNLRCRYCYELPLLGDRTRMSPEQIERMFQHVAEGYSTAGEPVMITFQWHGGEPLLIPPDIYRRIFETQRRIFAGSGHQVRNAVQSNFTVMDADRISLLREFDSVGVSLDLFTKLRVNQSGVCQEERARENLEKVRAAGIEVGGVTVLSRLNLAHMPEIYQFYRERRMPFRVLPLEKGFYAPGQDFELGPQDVLRALCALFDLWLADDAPVPISPLDRHLFLACHAHEHPDNSVSLYDPAQWTSVLLVDTHGAVYTYGGRFGRSLGNLFTTPLDQILRGSEFQDDATEAKKRIRETCTDCRYYGRACTGDPMGECQQDVTEPVNGGGWHCVVARGILEHIETRLNESRAAPGGRAKQRARMLAGRVLCTAA